MLNYRKFYANGFFHAALDGQKSEVIFRCIESQKGPPSVGKNCMLSYIKFYADCFGRDVISADSPKIQALDNGKVNPSG